MQSLSLVYLSDQNLGGNNPVGDEFYPVLKKGI